MRQICTKKKSGAMGEIVCVIQVTGPKQGLASPEEVTSLLGNRR